MHLRTLGSEPETAGAANADHFLRLPPAVAFFRPSELKASLAVEAGSRFWLSISVLTLGAAGRRGQALTGHHRWSHGGGGFVWRAIRVPASSVHASRDPSLRTSLSGRWSRVRSELQCRSISPIHSTPSRGHVPGGTKRSRLVDA